MSRSYKKNPYVTDHHRGSSKFSKRKANHSFRQMVAEFDEDMPARPQHKKYTDSYDICDYKSRMSREEAIDYYKSHCEDENWKEYFEKRYPTLEVWLKHWEKHYRRK